MLIKRNMIFLSILLSARAFAGTTDTPIPPGATVATWAYSTTWSDTPGDGLFPWSKGNDIDDLWVNNLSCYNGDSAACATAQPGNPPNPSVTPTPVPAPSFSQNNNPINQIIYYGGDLEAYCDGTGQPVLAPNPPGGDDESITTNGAYTCSPNDFYTSYYGPFAGLVKIGDPRVDTGKAMKSDLKKWGVPTSNSFVFHGTCDNFDGVGCVSLKDKTTPISTSYWDTYVAKDIAAAGGGANFHTTSGFRAGAEYSHVTMNGKSTSPIPIMIADIDGRLDVADMDNDFLDGLNIMSTSDAQHLADFVAKNICADDTPSGVQFDLEPFDFTNTTGRLNSTSVSTDLIQANKNLGTTGQKDFYKQIAKDFAGWYGNNADPAGINNTRDPKTGAYLDPLHCVDKAHPNGRFFSVFTFSAHINQDVVDVFTHHNNGLIVDSLYDLTSNGAEFLQAAGVTANKARGTQTNYSTTPEDGGSPTCPSADSTITQGNVSQTYPGFQFLVRTEIANVQKLMQEFTYKDGNPLAYQFGVPAGASAHEFEARIQYAPNYDPKTGAPTPTTISTFSPGNPCVSEKGFNHDQGGYVTAALTELKNAPLLLNDPSYKGIAIYGFSQRSWWSDVSKAGAPENRLLPDYPNVAALTALATGYSVGGGAMDSLGHGNDNVPPVTKKGPSASLNVWTALGAGTIKSSPAGINCRSCDRAYLKGTEVTLTAIPDTGYIFSGWLGSGCEGIGSCRVKLNRNKQVQAKFIPIKQ